jgi:hypothetical protein
VTLSLSTIAGAERDEVARTSAADFARSLAGRWQQMLGTDLLGSYLIGSLAHAGFSHRYSDIDIALVTAAGLSTDALDNLRSTRAMILSGTRAAKPVATSPASAAVNTKPYQYIAGDPPPFWGSLEPLPHSLQGVIGREGPVQVHRGRVDDRERDGKYGRKRSNDLAAGMLSCRSDVVRHDFGPA